MSTQRTPGAHPLVSLVKLATQRGGSKESSAPSGSSLAVYLVFVGLAVAGFAVMGFLISRARRKAARMAFQLRKAKEEQHRALEDAKLSGNAERREAANYEVQHLYEKIGQLKKELERNRAVTAERVKAVQEAVSWKELGL